MALQAAEEGNAALRARVTDTSKRLTDLAELRAENAALQRRVEELGRGREARQALEAKISKQQEEVSSFARSAQCCACTLQVLALKHCMEAPGRDQCQ